MHMEFTELNFLKGHNLIDIILKKVVWLYLISFHLCTVFLSPGLYESTLIEPLIYYIGCLFSSLLRQTNV